MVDAKTRNSVLRQLAALSKMSAEELREKWKDLYGCEPPNYRSTFLVKRLAYRIQELFYGGLSDDAQRKLEQLATVDSLCIPEAKKAADERVKGKGIFPGTRFIREWNGKRHEVIARENGFEYDGRMFRSLTAVAVHITGVKRSGNHFFGLPPNHREK